MEKFVKGDVVVLLFPFSDFSQSKKRPALVLANLKGEDIIVCQITSSGFGENSISLAPEDFASGSLNRESFARPDKLFTVSCALVNYKAGSVKKEKLIEVLDKIVDIIRK